MQALLNRGVPPHHITVVGASKGAIMAMLVSTKLKNRDVNFVLLSDCNDDVLNRFNMDLWGNILSIYDVNDEFGQSCEKFFAKATRLNKRKEIELKLGTGHAILYRPIKEWIEPTVEWARQTADEAMASPCGTALTQNAVCEAANNRALEIMRRRQVQGFTVVQDVRTGALVAFAATDPSTVDVTTLVLPLSVAKLFTAGCWWDHHETEPSGNSGHSAMMVSVHEMIVGGSDAAGRQLAVALRQSIGTAAVLADLQHYGLGTDNRSYADDTFGSELAPSWHGRLLPVRGYTSLANDTPDLVWADALSIGENHIFVTGLQVSRFLQAVGNGGLMLPPVVRTEEPEPPKDIAPERLPALQPDAKPVSVMQESTALKLQAAMRDTVQRGTAKTIAAALTDLGWQIGGKTGTGPGPEPIGPKSDGWFAGLIFDSEGKARFTVATFLKHAGPGGGNAAKVSAELARYLAGDVSRKPL